MVLKAWQSFVGFEKSLCRAVTPPNMSLPLPHGPQVQGDPCPGRPDSTLGDLGPHRDYPDLRANSVHTRPPPRPKV